MDDDRVAARDALLRRSRRLGLVLTVLAAASTGGVTGLLARAADRAEAATPVPAPAPTTAPDSTPPPPPVPRAKRTVFVDVPAARSAAPAPRPARPAPPPPVRTQQAPARTQQAPVTRSDGS